MIIYKTYSSLLMLILPSLSSSSLQKARHQQIEALGRHFSLGALYDVRRELLLGTYLWNQGNIDQNKSVTSLNHQEFQIKAANSFKQKSEFMDIGGSIKMSFLGGLLDISGSAKYLESRKSKGKLASVSAQWSATTHVESLTQEFFSNIEFPENLDPSRIDDATHVVTRIVYGANAYFRFEKFLKEKESQKDVTGEMEGKFGGMFSIKGEVNISEKDKSFVEDIRVIFNGDFYGITPPTTFSDAVTVVKELADAKEEDMVPMRVTLTPLHMLDDHAIRLLREVNQDTIRQAAELKSFFEFVDTSLEDELISNSVTFFPELRRNVQFLHRKFQQQDDYFRKQLQILLPGIRNNSIPEQDLTNVLDKLTNGVFHQSFYNNWLSTRNGYANVLADILRTAEKQRATILHDDNSLTTFQFQNKQSYYVLEGSLTGANEEPYIKALKENKRDIIENAPIDKTSWIYTFKIPTLRRITRFENVDDVQTYTKEETEKVSKIFNENLLKKGVQKSKLTGFAAGLSSQRQNVALSEAASQDYEDKEEYEGIDLPKKAIRIAMPGLTNTLRIKTYYSGQEVKLKVVHSIKFTEKDEYLQFDLQEIKLEVPDYYPDDYPDYYPNFSGGQEENPIAGYEISLKESTRTTPDYYLNVLSKDKMTHGETYYINVRVVLKGGVRGPWNRKPYLYTKPETKIVVAGSWSPWSTVGSCSKTCGGGQQKLRRTCDRPSPVNGGLQCQKQNGGRGLQDEKMESCNTKICPVNCEVGPWVNWGSCSKTCGGGRRSRNRSVTRAAQGGGSACPALRVEGDCNTHGCKKDCNVGPWSSCSKTCGGGRRTRQVTIQSVGGGRSCPHLTELCYSNTCPYTCESVLEEWRQNNEPHGHCFCPTQESILPICTECSRSDGAGCLY